MPYRSLLISVLIFFSPTFVFAVDLSQTKESSTPVELEADQLSYDRENGIYHASGDVRLLQGDLEVRGPSLQWNQKSGDISADNGIRLISPDEELSGSRASYNIIKGTGTIDQGTIYLREENLHIKGDRIERLGESQFHVEGGTFTTCDGDVPSWKFGASQIDVTMGGYARARNMVFYLKDIPSLYFPYMIYPAKTERESGLLIPGIGYSDKRGFQYNAAYYQVLGINQDATFFLDYLSKMGIGKGLEYRYVFGNENAGEARLYHIDVDEVDDVVVDEERYAIEWQHSGWLPGGVRVSADIEYVNDDDYFDDFGGVAEEYNKDSVESVFSLTKSWGKSSLVGEMKYTKDLETEDDTTLQRLPRVTFDIARTRLADSIFSYSFDSEYTHFWRQEGLTGERLMVKPTLAADIQLSNAISVTPEIAYRERFYWGLSDDRDDDNNGLPEFSTKIHTRLQKIYNGGFWGISKLKHTLEPEVTYRYIPEKDQAHLASFDSYDRIAEKNQVESALLQKLTARFDLVDQVPVYRDLLYLRLSQIYNLTSEASGKRYEKIRAEMILRPIEGLTLDVDTIFDVDQGEWSDIAVDLDIGEKDGNQLSVDYRYDRDDDTKYGSINLSVDFLKPVYLNYQQRYDFVDDNDLEQIVGIEYRQDCWSALLTFSERDDDGVKDRSMMLSFTMRGIGSIGGVSGSLGGI